MNLKKVVSFSGGRTSAYLCKVMKDLHGDDVDFIYMDTGMEHPKTYEFIKRVDKEFGLNLTCLKTKFNQTLGQANTYEIIDIESLQHDVDQFRQMMKKYGTPYNPGGAFCTDRLKLVPYGKYCNDKYGKKSYVTYLGIRADEPKRLKPKPYYEFLATISDFDKQDILEWWSEQSFDLELSGEHLGNCVFCIKKGNNKIALAARDEPQLAEQFLELLNEDSVRTVEKRKSPPLEMYRGRLSFDGVMKSFLDHSDDEIRNTIRSMRRDDTNSCSESCEVFGKQIELFND